MKASGTNQKLSWFFREDNAGNLNLAPSFQRKPVWSDEMASFLIDSILSSLPIPEVYVRSTSSPEGETKHEVVDGQQRIRSILRFARNDLELIGDDDLKLSARWQNRSFEDLSNAEKQAFWSYELVVRDLGEASDAEIRDLFRRLNINQMPLTDQEIRHATFSGAFIKLMELLADNEWWLESKIVTIRQVRRMDDVEFISELFIGMMAGPQNKKDSLDGYYHDYEQDFPEGAALRDRFDATRELISLILKPADVRAWSGKSDFYTIFLAFSNLISAGTKVPAAKRTDVRDALMKFQKNVNDAKKKGAKPASVDVGNYAEAVTRAASDLARRASRLEILEKVIDKAL